MVKPFDGDFYTQAKKETEVWVEEMRTTRQALGVELSFGAVSVSEQVIAFQRKRLGDNEVIDTVALDLPEQNFVTQALWYVIGERMAAALPSEVLLGALHASEHGQIAVLPLIAMCDRWDIGGLSTNIHQQTGAADDLHLRRPPGRGRDHPARLRGVRAAGRRRRPPDPRVPLRGRLPLLRAEPEVRQPQRAPAQGRARWS